MTYPIPPNALAHHVAILGKTGSGKTTAAKAGAETILDAGGRVCVVDPTGAWWGMKSSATGKSAGYPFVVFGGSHADFPLGATHGEALAEIVGTSNTPAILDTSQMKVSERTRFFTDFADAIMRKNRGPLHLYVDEAHVFMPQGKVPDPQAGVMLAAGNNMVSGGRSRGLRITLITQRPAKLHKDSLTQVETLVAMRLIAPQDRKAVEEWIKDNADDDGKQIIASLPTLRVGEGWVWSPEANILERVRFPRIRTFDSSAAPDGDDVGGGPVLAPVDSETIRTRLSTIAAEVVANDPKALRARIAELDKQVRDLKAAPAQEVDQGAEQRGYERGWREGATEQRSRMVPSLATITNATATINRIARELDVAVNDAYKVNDPKEETLAIPAFVSKSVQKRVVAQMAGPRGPTFTGLVPAPRARQIDARAPSSNGELTGAERKVLTVLSQYDACEIGKLALLTGYAVTGGAFRNTLGALRTKGLLEGENTGAMRITEDGLHAGPFDEMPTGEALRQHWLNHASFGKSARDSLAALLENPRGLTLEQIAEVTAREAAGGAFRNGLGELRTAGVLVGKNTGVMTASAELLG